MLLALGAVVLLLLAELLLARHRLQALSQRDGLRRRPQRLRHRRVLRELLLLRRQIPEIGEMFASCYSLIISIKNDALNKSFISWAYMYKEENLAQLLIWLWLIDYKFGESGSFPSLLFAERRCANSNFKRYSFTRS